MKCFPVFIYDSEFDECPFLPSIFVFWGFFDPLCESFAFITHFYVTLVEKCLAHFVQASFLSYWFSTHYSYFLDSSKKLSYSHFSHFYFCKLHGKNILTFYRSNGWLESEAEWVEEVGRDD